MLQYIIVSVSYTHLVSCSTTLADATARLVVDDMTVSASTTSKKRTVEAVYNLSLIHI